MTPTEEKLIDQFFGKHQEIPMTEKNLRIIGEGIRGQTVITTSLLDAVIAKGGLDILVTPSMTAKLSAAQAEAAAAKKILADQQAEKERVAKQIAHEALLEGKQRNRTPLSAAYGVESSESSAEREKAAKELQQANQYFARRKEFSRLVDEANNYYDTNHAHKNEAKARMLASIKKEFPEFSKNL